MQQKNIRMYKMLEFYTNKMIERHDLKYFIEMIHYASKCMPVNDFNLWMQTPLQPEFPDYHPLYEIKNLQIIGKKNILILIINEILDRYPLEKLLPEVINIYIDTIHLGGNYESASRISEGYLKFFCQNEIMNDKDLLRMKIRKIHCSMFFDPVNKLIDEGKTIFNEIDKTRFPLEYNELLFLLGGNLGVLSGDFESSEYYLKLLMDNIGGDTENNPNNFYTRRVSRKLADIRIFNSNFSEAMAILMKCSTTAGFPKKISSRYEIYMTASLGELYRKTGKIEEACKCFSDVGVMASEFNIISWRAHAYLGLGMISLQQNDLKNADKYFKKAEEIYTQINMMWGIVNVGTAQVIMNNMDGFNNYVKTEQLKLIANKMNYRYNESVLESLPEKIPEHFQLFFL